MQKKVGAVGAMPPTHYLSKPRGGGGVSHTRTGPGHPPCKGEQNQKWLPHRPYFFFGSRLRIEISVGRVTKKAYLAFVFFKKKV